MPGKKQFNDFGEVKTGKDLVQFSTERGGEVHSSSHGTKIKFPGKGSFLVNTNKELSKHDRGHFKFLLKAMGIISVLFVGLGLLAVLAQSIVGQFGYQIVWF